MTEAMTITPSPDRWQPSQATLTVAELMRAAPHLWEPAFALACAQAGPSAGEFVAAYVESVACLAGSARWERRAAEERIAGAAQVTGAVLTDADWLHLWRCYHDADPGLAAEYRVSADGHHGSA